MTNAAAFLNREIPRIAQAVADSVAAFANWMNETYARIDLEEWVRYDRAGAPYGYMRKDRDRWLAEHR